MRDTIDMAREAGIDLYGLGANHERFVGVIKAFEALVRADAIADEREACAKEAENMNESVLALLNVTSQPKAIARKIRSRGNT
jgi:hypothetical protein